MISILWKLNFSVEPIRAAILQTRKFDWIKFDRIYNFSPGQFYVTRNAIARSHLQYFVDGDKEKLVGKKIAPLNFY